MSNCKKRDEMVDEMVNEMVVYCEMVDDEMMRYDIKINMTWYVG